MSASRKPVSLGDIAKAAGLARSTVSYALRNDPNVSRQTCERVQEIARQLEYMPDAAIAGWMDRVRKTKQREPIPIAWLNTSKRPDAWRDASLRPYIEGARERCRELGYKLEEFWTEESGMTQKRISSILYNRGIKGLIISPSPSAKIRHLNLEWKHFACATFEGSILAPRLHRVLPDYLSNTLMALKTLRRMGYRRIGVFLQLETKRSALFSYPAAIGYFNSRLPASERVPSLFYRNENENPELSDKFAVWMKKYRPDVVVGYHSQLIEWVEAQGYRVPQEVGVAHLAIDGDVEEWSGVWQCKKIIGAETAELVISLVKLHRLGLPETPRDILIQGLWHSGRTLVKPKASGLLAA